MAKAQTTAQMPAQPVGPPAATPASTARPTWREALPVLSNALLTLREPVATDAVALMTALPEDALSQIVAARPAASLPAFERLIEQLQAGRRAGTTACWVIVPADTRIPVGVVGVRALDHSSSMVEGFAVMAEEFRGTALFQAAGRLVLGCLFGQMGVQRVEFRIDVRNGRANGALRKLGATQEGLLRRARAVDGEFRDQVLWAIVATDWNDSRAGHTSSVH